MPTATRIDWARLAAQAAFAGFVLSVLLGLLLPIYTDEVTWRMQLRAGIDGGIDAMPSDICGPNTIVAPPWFMMPHRWMTGWLNLAFPDPLYVRIVGVASALAWAFLLRALIGRIAGDSRQRHILTAVGFGLLGFGVLPIMMVMSRPDATVLLCVTGAILACIVGRREAAGAPWRAWAWPGLVALLGVVALSAHLKGILFAPVFLLCLFAALPARAAVWKKGAVLVAFALLALQSAHYWVDRFRCPDDPVMAAMLDQQNLASVLAGSGDWQGKLATALAGASPNTYLHVAEASPRPMSAWLPPGRIDSSAMVLRKLAMLTFWDLAMLLATACLAVAAWRSLRERRLDFAFALPVVLAGLVLVWSASQLVKNAYEAMIVLPVLAIAILFAIAGIGPTGTLQRWLGRAAIVLVVLSLAAQADVARRYLPPFAAAAAQPGYVAGQPYSVSPYGYGTIRERIRATARQCGIGSQGRAIRPLVDDTTYFAFVDSLRPFHAVSVIGKWKGRIGDPIAYIGDHGSQGAILGCRTLPAGIRARAIQNGEFCCVPTR